MSLNPKQRLQLAIALAFVLILLDALVPYRSLHGVRVATQAAQHAELRLDLLAQLLATLAEAESAQRGFLLQRDEALLEPYQRAREGVSATLNQLAAANTSADETEAFPLGPVRSGVTGALSRLAEDIERQRSGAPEGPPPPSAALPSPLEAPRTLIAGLLRRQQDARAAAHARLEAALADGRLSVALLVAANLAVFLLIYLFLRRTMAEREAAEQAARRSAQEAIDARDTLTAYTRELEHHRRDQEHLSRLANQLLTVPSLTEAYRVVSILAAQLFSANPGALYLRRSPKDDLEPVCRWGTPRRAPARIRSEDCLAVQGADVARVDDPTADPVCPHLDEAPGGAIPHVCVPLQADGEVGGVLCIEGAEMQSGSGRHLPLDDRTVFLGRLLAEQLALGLSNLRLREALTRQSVMDGLTGLHNRRFLDATLRREVARAVRHRTPLAVVMIDIDHFKQVNDSYGHEAGDLVLRAVGQLVQRQIRASDVACRFGGEELTVVLPGSSAENAAMRAETLRRALQTIALEHAGRILPPVTASFGVAAYPDHGGDADALLRAADAALYAAKRAGRDRVQVAEAAADSPAAVTTGL